MDASNAAAAADLSLSPSSTSSQDVLSDYLLSLLPLLLSASHTDIRRSFLDPSNAALLARFANEQQVQSIYINKIREERQSSASASAPTIDNVQDHEGRALDTSPSNSATARFGYTVTSTLSWHPDNAASLALIKRVPSIDSSRSIAEQIHVLNLFGPALSAASSSTSGNTDKTVAIVDDEDGQATSRANANSAANPYGSLHSIVHLAVQPYFEAYISRKANSVEDSTDAMPYGLPSSGSGNALSNKAGPLGTITAAAASIANKKNKDGNDLSSNTGIPIAKKKFAELELSLLHLQQNVEIPETVLGVHPVVMRAIEQVRATHLVPIRVRSF